MGTGHLTGGAWGPGGTGICPRRRLPPPGLREARGSGSLLGDPGLVNLDYQVGSVARNIMMSCCPTALLVPST